MFTFEISPLDKDSQGTWPLLGWRTRQPRYSMTKGGDTKWDMTMRTARTPPAGRHVTMEQPWPIHKAADEDMMMDL